MSVPYGTLKLYSMLRGTKGRGLAPRSASCRYRARVAPMGAPCALPARPALRPILNTPNNRHRTRPSIRVGGSIHAGNAKEHPMRAPRALASEASRVLRLHAN